MNEQSKMTKLFSSIWFWWFILMAIYLLLQYFFPFKEFSIVTRLTLFIGIFVPIASNSIGLLYALFPLSLILVFILFFIFKFIQKWLDKSDYSQFEKIILILGILFAMTVLVDTIMGSPYESLRAVVTGKAPHYQFFDSLN